MRALIYDSVIFRPLLNFLGKAYLRMIGWRVVGPPPDIDKFVVIAAPHTSNWDFPTFMALVGYCGIRVRYLAKDTLFQGLSGKLFYWLGGIPVVRDTRDAAALVDVAVDLFKSEKELILAIAPEGTRSKVTKWKSGFYRIAHTANVPIVMAYLDANKRELGFGDVFYPTGDRNGDIEKIKAFYAQKRGLKSKKHPMDR